MKTLVVCLFVALAISSCLACEQNSDCKSDECCAGTPNGSRVCVRYHELDEQCIFSHKTPSCGCAAGLKCVGVHGGLGHCKKESETTVTPV